MATSSLFIAYPAEAEATALALCEGLERAGLACWIAPRDLPLDMGYDRAIAAAIERATLVVCVGASAAAASSSVQREVTLALAAGLPILPFQSGEETTHRSLTSLIHAIRAVQAERLKQLHADSESAGIPLASGIDHLKRPLAPQSALQAGLDPWIAGLLKKLALALIGGALLILAINTYRERTHPQRAATPATPQIEFLRVRGALDGHADAVDSVAIHPNGQVLASGGRDHRVLLWDIATETVAHELEGHTDFVKLVAFSPNGALLASASWDGTVRLWDAATGAPLRTLSGHTGYVWSVAWHPAGTMLASASADGTARLWDIHSGETLRVFKGHEGPVLSVAFSPDGALLATASEDTTARLWRLADGYLVNVLAGHTGFVWAVAFRPDGAQVATASTDGTARLWAVRPAEALLEWRVLGGEGGHTDYLWCLSYSPDGARLATGGRDKTVRLWDTATGVSLGKLERYNSINSVAFAPDGERIAIGTAEEREIKFYRLRAPLPVIPEPLR